MCGTEARKELPPTPSGSGCNCCSTDAPEDSVTGTGGADYAIEGLTCAHCVATLRKAATALDGVEAAFVELVPGGRSRLVISGSASHTAIRNSVASAGYSLITR
jgi:copper chaperone